MRIDRPRIVSKAGRRAPGHLRLRDFGVWPSPEPESRHSSSEGPALTRMANGVCHENPDPGLVRGLVPEVVHYTLSDFFSPGAVRTCGATCRLGSRELHVGKWRAPRRGDGKAGRVGHLRDTMGHSRHFF
jgi:hypothetical protein